MKLISLAILGGEDDRKSLIRIHEQVNGLSAASYGTLKHMDIQQSR
jgi:hypothetical protein